MADSTAKPVECGFCLQCFEGIEDPRTLPCGHVHCFRCLNSSFEANYMTQCPLTACRRAFDTTLDTLPTHIRITTNCEVSTKKGNCKQAAVIYCTICTTRLCRKHHESHDDVMDHPTIDIDEYMAQTGKLEVRKCSVHKQQPYSVGCKVCLKLFCLECMLGVDTCTDGNCHELHKLDELVTLLTSKVEDLKSRMLTQEENFEKLFKLASKSISEFDDQTKQMVETIHVTRDEQIKSIKVKYEELEEGLLKQRQETRKQLVEFMESDVTEKWTNFRNQRLRIKATIEQRHKCDLVTGYGETTDAIERLLNEELPALLLENVFTLKSRDEQRDIELEMLPEDLSIDSDGFAVTAPLVRSLTEVNAVSVFGNPTSVCMHRGNTYVAIEYQSVVLIGDQRLSESPFLQLEDHAVANTIHKDQLYILIGGSPAEVLVYDLEGNIVNQWSHSESNVQYTKLAIVSDCIVIPSIAGNNCLYVYSLSGRLLRQIGIPQFASSYYSALCAVGDNCVVVSDYGSSQVVRVNISSGEVVWTCTEIYKPGGVTCYRRTYVIVHSYSTGALYVIDSTTGAVKIVLHDIAASTVNQLVFDLDIAGDTLVVPNYSSSRILYLKMNRRS